MNIDKSKSYDTFDPSNNNHTLVLDLIKNNVVLLHLTSGRL